MRILRLQLLRYGPFTDRVLSFRSDAKLHVVYGPNEAGKSSSLAAIGDLLFGFGKRKEYDFLHDAATLRIGAELVARNGEPLSFRRRRGNKNTLLANDEGETPLHEDVLAPFLGNLNRDVFGRAFGLNSQTLRQGGEAMLESEGEMGATLFAAASGLTGLARVRRRLESEAEAIFAPHPSRERSFYQALGRYEEVITLERRSELKPGDWRALLGEIAELERQLAEVKARRTAVGAALSRLQQLKVLEPIVTSIDVLEAEISSFADLPEMPDGFVAECRAAIQAAEGADADERVAADEALAARTAFETIESDPGFFENSEKIVDLFSRKGEYLSKLAEIPHIEAERDRFDGVLVELGRPLGFTEPEELLRRLPPDSVIQTARSIIDQGLALEAAIAADEKRIAEERAAIDAQDAEALAGALVDPKPWRDQFAALGPDLKQLNEQEYLESSHRNMVQKVADAGMRLNPQVADIEQLARATLPKPDMLMAYRASFERLLNDRRAEALALETNQRHHAEAIQKLGANEQGGPVAYEETIRLVRADRDRSFAQIRNHLMRHGRMLTPDQVTERLTLFEEEIAEADRIADQAIADAQRLSQIANLRDEIAALEGERPKIQARLDELAEEQARTVESYNQLFASAGVTPVGPDAMVTWLAAVEDLLATRKDVAALAAQIAALERLGDRIRSSLLKLARALKLEVLDNLPALALSRLIAGALDDMQGRWSSRLTREGARQAGLVRLDQLQDSLTKSLRQYRDWGGRYEQILPMLGLDRSVTTEAAAAALDVWQQVPEAGRERAARATRAAELRRETNAYAQAVRDLARQLIPVLVELPPQGLIDVLRERAETARAARARQDDAKVRLEIAETRLAAARGARDAAAAALRRLAMLLPAQSDPRLELDRLTQRAALRLQLAERREEFAARADGASEDSIRAELPGFDRARAPFDAEDLERQGEALNAENNRLYAQLGQKQMQRDALERGSGAEPAAFQRTGVEAELVGIARQWAVRRIAAIMLGAAIDRHRADQSDPLLVRAGEHFSTLTSGSFAGLVQDYDEEDRPRLAGLRKTGERVPIAGMSEGTRDQLYLSLRLAYLEDYAGRTEPVPFIGDDIFQTFDDERTHAGVRALASAAGLFQPILFTHHLSVVAIARRALGDDLDYVEL